MYAILHRKCEMGQFLQSYPKRAFANPMALFCTTCWPRKKLILLLLRLWNGSLQKSCTVNDKYGTIICLRDLGPPSDYMFVHISSLVMSRELLFIGMSKLFTVKRYHEWWHCTGLKVCNSISLEALSMKLKPCAEEKFYVDSWKRPLLSRHFSPLTGWEFLTQFSLFLQKIPQDTATAVFLFLGSGDWAREMTAHVFKVAPLRR